MQISSKMASPLDTVVVRGIGCAGSLEVRDGEGVLYETLAAEDGASFVVSGAPGSHVVLLLDGDGRVVDSASFRVAVSTAVEDEGGIVKELLGWLSYTLESWLDGVGNDFVSRIDGKTYHYFVCWLRDHVHTLKGQKYFYPGELKTAIELYADTQREDGMVYDRIASATPNPTWRDYTFAEGDFIKPVADGKYRMERIPVENDVEFLFLEGLYCTWRATGDTEWMAKYLDSAIKAVRYATSDKYRWSTKFGLLKRGYTIDTWDFMHADDTKLTSGNNVVGVDKTTFGVMHGDNTGFAAGLGYLSKMLKAAGRAEEAAEFGQMEADIRRRLDELAWNGQFYTHHVSEDPTFKRDFGGTDASKQVSLSNAYNLNRGIGAEKSVGIIKTYQRIREEMPETSPGEFYQIYPPFENGYGKENGKWHYMNGGVGTIVAGELAKGAFENGYEQYGGDIIRRVHQWGVKYGGYLPVALKGCNDVAPVKDYQTVDITVVANVDFCGEGDPANGVIGWTDEAENDLYNMPVGSQNFKDIPFEVIDPAENGRRAAIGIASAEGYYSEVEVPLGRKANSLYVLHTLAGAGLAGWMTVSYADGEKEVVYIEDGKQVRSWFMPPADWKAGGVKSHATSKAHLAWWGANRKFDNVGVILWGYDNPYPEKEIESLSFTAAQNSNKWFVLGLTTSDSPVEFAGDGISFGIPDCWGASAMIYAILEGMAGVADCGVAMDEIRVSPRWASAGINKASACVAYPASGGYASYNYDYSPKEKRLRFNLAMKADQSVVRLLLEGGASPVRVIDCGEEVEFKTEQVGASTYLVLTIHGRKSHSYDIEFKF